MANTEDPKVARPTGKNYPLIGVFNGNPDVLEAIRAVLSDAGLNVVIGYIDDLKRGHVDFIQWLEHHDPKVLIYDVGAPFEVRRIAPDINAYEILGKPFDLG